MSHEGAVTWILARVERKPFRADARLVEEAVGADTLEQVPHLPTGAVGLLRWRGAAHTVWSPQRALRVAPATPGAVLFLRGARGRVAVAVDDAEDLITLPASRVRPLPGVTDGGGLVLGGIQFDEGFATVIAPAVLADLVCASVTRSEGAS